MAKRMKVYLPRWVLWVILPILAVVWSVMSYITFATADGRQQLGIVGWLAMTAIVVLVGVMMFLMTGRLPAYIIEMDDESPPRPGP